MKIKYFSSNYPRLKQDEKGNWIDLRVDSIKNNKLADKVFKDTGEFKYFKGDIFTVGLGVAVELPAGYEALIAPRSSTFKHWGLVQTNSVGVIDTTYCGNNDEWMVQFKAERDGTIRRFERVCQFRIIKSQPAINFNEVDKLEGDDRGGYGTSGRL